MKDNFIPKFIKAFIETGKEMYEIWQWQPIYYKGWKVSGPDYNRVYGNFKNLEKRELVSRTGNDGYKFTKKGAKWFEVSKFKYLELNDGKWDKKWRVVIFDVPQEMHNQRNWLRKKLKNLGFYMLQKSVFVYPYSCEEELGHICSYLDVSDFVDVIISDSIGFQEQEVKKFFGLR